MSDTQAKATPSKAARELAMRLFASDHGMSHMDKLPEFGTLRLRHQSVVEKYEQIIHSALSDLLEKADKVLLLTHEHISPTLAKELRLELSRWKY